MKIKTLIKTIFALSLILFISGCTQSKSPFNQFSKFENEFTLKSQEINIEEKYKHARIIQYDTLYILTNTPGNNQQIHIYNKEFKYITSSGVTGKGPREISNPFPAVIDKENKSVWMMDMGRRNIAKFPVDSMLSNSNFLPHEFVAITNECPIIVQYSPYKNGLFAFADFYSNETIISFNNKSGQLVDSLKILKSDALTNLENANPDQFNVTFIYEKHPQKNIFALAYKYSDKIAIVNSKSKVLSISQGPYIINQTPDASSSTSLISCYTDIQCDENYIYALYRGQRIFNDRMEQNFPESIHVFNWSGKPVAKLNLQHPVVSFTINNITQGFISFSQLTGGIVNFNLPSKLKKDRS